MIDKSTLLLELGLHIQNLRKEKGISQSKFAFECEMEKANMCRIESGKVNVSINVLYRISQTLGIHLKDLFDFYE